MFDFADFLIIIIIIITIFHFGCNIISSYIQEVLRFSVKMMDKNKILQFPLRFLDYSKALKIVFIISYEGSTK